MKHLTIPKKTPSIHALLVDMWDFRNESISVTDDDIDKNIYRKSQYTMIRVSHGSCCLKTKDEELTLHENAFIVFDSKSFVSLECKSDCTMTAFNFNSDKSPVFFTKSTIYQVPFEQTESQLKSMILSRYQEHAIMENSIIHPLFESLYFAIVVAYQSIKMTHSVYSKEIQQAVDYINQNLGEKISFSTLSSQLNLSERNFRKMFTLIMGVSPKAYQQEVKMQGAVSMLKEGEMTINEISEALGYYSQFQFSSSFKKRFGCNPTEYKKRM